MTDLMKVQLKGKRRYLFLIESEVIIPAFTLQTILRGVQNKTNQRKKEPRDDRFLITHVSHRTGERSLILLKTTNSQMKRKEV